MDKSKVGYCRPPQEHQFKKGKSGNPKGRPKGSKNLDTLITRELEKHIKVTDNGVRRSVRKVEVMARQLVDKAVQCDFRAIATLQKMGAMAGEQGPEQGYDGSADESELSDDAYREVLAALVGRLKERK